jgi:Flp pilus assembly protein CpaB
MNRTGWVLLIFGILTSIVAGLGVFVLLTINQPKPAPVETTKLVVAFQNISPRTEITDGQVGVADWPSVIPTPIGGLADPKDAVGKLSNTMISPGQPVISSMLIDKSQVEETHSNAALLLEKGTVAKAMQVNIVSNVAEALQAGDRVDVIATFEGQSTTGPASSITQRLLADALILQVGPWPKPGAKDQSSATGTTVITLQLKEQEALVLEYAIEHASTVTLFLRPANDHDILTLDPVTLDYITQRYGYRVTR